MKSALPNRSKKIILALILTVGMLLAKEFTDNLGYTYSTDKVNNTGNIEFIQIRGESVTLMSDINSNRAVSVLPSKTFIQLVDRDNDWLFVRVPDSNEGYIEGWVRDNKVKKEKDGSPSLFYGKALMLMEDIIRKRPAWVVNDSTALLSLPKPNAKNIGDIFFSTKIFIQNEITDYFQVKIFDDYDQKYIDGWVVKNDLTEDEKMISGDSEPVAQQQTTPDKSADNSKIQEIKAKIEALEKQKKEKEAEEFIANAISKEVQFKAMKMKKHQEDFGLINNSIEEYRKEIASEQQHITEFNQEIKNLEALISEKNQQNSDFILQKEALIKQQESELQAAKARELEEKQQQQTLFTLQADLQKQSSDLNKTDLELTATIKEIETTKAQIEEFNTKSTDLQSSLEVEQSNLKASQQKSAEIQIARQRELENKQAEKEELAKQLISMQEQKGELQKDLSAKNQEIEYFKKESALVNKESQDLTLELNKLNIELNQTEKALELIQKNNAAKALELNRLAENNTQQIARLTSELEAKNSQIEQAKKEQDRLSIDLENLKTEADQKKNSISEFHGKVNELKNQKLTKIAEAENQIKEREKLRKEQIEQLKNDLLQLKNDQNAINQEIGDLKTKNGALSAENNQNEIKKNSLKTELTKISAALAETVKKKEQADKIAAQKNALEQEKLKAFQAKLDEQNNKLADLKAGLEKKINEIEAARSEVKENKTAKELLEKSIADKKREINDHNIVTNSIKQQIAASQQNQIESQNKQKAELITIRESVKRLDTEIANSKLQLIAEQKSGKQLEAKLTELSTKLVANEARIIELKNKKIETAASRETKESDRKLALLNGQLKELKNRLSNVENQIFTAKDENRELALQNKKWENDLLDKSYDRDVLVADINKAKSKKGSAVSEQDALKAQLAELEQAQANLNKTGGETASKRPRKRGGFKRNSNDDGEESQGGSGTGNWNREPYSISMLISDKNVIITNLYKKYKTQDNLLSGQFTLKFDMGIDGKTKKVRITDAIWSNQSVGSELNKEIEKKVREWNFPPDNHPDQSLRKDKPIEIPYVF